jgi:hypothetical protein
VLSPFAYALHEVIMPGKQQLGLDEEMNALDASCCEAEVRVRCIRHCAYREDPHFSLRRS